MVRFVKRAIQPNPIEVDYWIDIKTDPYGKVWKYYNGYDWVEFNSDNSNNSELEERVEKVEDAVKKIGKYGETRPSLTTEDVGFTFFDTRLNKPIWWTGTKWVDGDGKTVRNAPIYSTQLYGPYVTRIISNTDAPNATVLVITSDSNSALNVNVVAFMSNDAIVLIPQVSGNISEYAIPNTWDSIEIKGNVSGTHMVDMYQE